MVTLLQVVWALLVPMTFWIVASPDRASLNSGWYVAAHYACVAGLLPLIVWWLLLCPVPRTRPLVRRGQPGARALLMSTMLVLLGTALPIPPYGPFLMLVVMVWIENHSATALVEDALLLEGHVGTHDRWREHGGRPFPKKRRRSFMRDALGVVAYGTMLALTAPNYWRSLATPPGLSDTTLFWAAMFQAPIGLALLRDALTLVDSDVLLESMVQVFDEPAVDTARSGTEDSAWKGISRSAHES